MIKAMAFENEEIIKDTSSENIMNFIKNKKKLWIDINNPDEKDMKLLQKDFKFHPLAIEDCLNKFERSKIDDYRDYYFIVIHSVKGLSKNRRIVYSQIYIFVCQNYIITIHFENVKPLDFVWNRIISGMNIKNEGIDFILYNILDSVTDDFFPLTDRIGENIDRIEDLILKNPGKKVEDEIILLKRNMLKFRRIISPQREVLNTLLRHDIPLISEKNRMYFMDVYDHILRIYDLIDSYHDLLSGSMDLYMTQISNRMNAVMKILTIITTIATPLSLITGIYGMNFKYMPPELDSRYGYYGVMLSMVAIVIVEIFYFKKKKWF